MTNEEAIEVLDAAGEGRSEEDWFAALDMGIAALKSQERMQRELKSLEGIAETCDKLDRALHDVWCHDCPYDDDVKLEHCWECDVKYYKRRAGIDS